jgi:hypothetical protein
MGTVLVYDVTAYGAVGDGVTNDASSIQAAITAAGTGSTVYFPKGKYRVNTTLQISTRGVTLLGDAGMRNVDGGTEIVFYGTGACIQVGTDDGLAWDRAGYDGVQDTWIERLWLSAGAPDTPLALDGTQSYKAGTYGIRDWRGGHVRVRDCGIERFEYNFWCIQSDFNHFQVVQSHYSKYGIYLGPRSDQAVLDQVMGFFAERLITLDKVSQCRIISVNAVGCGNATVCPIEIRKGCANVDLLYPWFEHLPVTAGSYSGTDQLAFVGIGIVDGYTPPGGVATTTAVTGVDVHAPTVLTAVANAQFHTRYVIAMDQAVRVRLFAPNSLAGASYTLNLDAIVATTTGATGTASAAIHGAPSLLSDVQLFKNNSTAGATPNWSAFLDEVGGIQLLTTGGRLSIRNPGAPAGADLVSIGAEGQAGQFWVRSPNYATGQTNRINIARALRHMGAAPSTGTWETGDIVLNTAPAAGGFIGWVCTAGGTPGTWKTWGAISP